MLNENLHLRQETNTPGVLRFKSFPKNMVFDVIRLLLRLLFDYAVETWSFQTKVSYYKSEINKSVMLHAFFKKKTKGIVLQWLTKTQKYPVTNKSIALRL